ncbi:MAG: alpha/beta hydrolase [Pseudomonadota bacterium]
MDDDLSLASRLGWEQLVSYQTINGHKIAVAQQRAETAAHRPLLLLHGFPTCTWDFYKIWPQLAEGRTLIAPDFLGFGLSDKPKGHIYSIAEQADICEAVLAEANAADIDVLAHDYGTTVAQELLARQREGTAKLAINRTIFLNGGILPEGHRPRPIQHLLAGPLGPLVSKLLSKDRFKRSFSAVFGPNTQPVDAELNMLWDFMTENDGHRVMHRLLRYMAERAANRARWVPPILEPDIPLLIINGHLDPVSGKHLIDAYRALGGKAEIVDMPDVGHYPQLEAPEAVKASVLTFLGQP